MPQAIWKGSVSFGMVTIPVKVYAATQEKDISFRQVHAEDGGRIRYKRVCELDGEEVPYSDIAKGYELPDGGIVILTAEDFGDLPLPSRHSIEVLEFVPADDFDPIYVARSYYLQAEGPGAKPYVLLRDALENTGQVAVVKVALRNRESLAIVRNKNDSLVLQTMLWPDEVRDDATVAPPADVEVRPQEVAMAESYIQTLSTVFDPDRYHDEYRKALEELIDAKTEGRTVEAVEEAAPAGEVVDLMAALQASVDAARKRRGEAPREAPAEKAPAAKKAAKKAPAAKKTAAKKTAKKAAKAPARKSA
jgi:DNA end-binding protein Ku